MSHLVIVWLFDISFEEIPVLPDFGRRIMFWGNFCMPSIRL